MLDKYKEDYKEFYSIINNAIKENKINHAYMFQIDDNIDQDIFIKDICKILILKDQLNDQNIINLIDNDNYPNIKRIRADGMWIKKEQILEVQTDFRKESFDNNLKIYVIEDATKLNKSSANTLLKFLEEPEKNIVAILFTKNKYSVITTIMSRCTNINLIKKEYLDISPDNISYKFVEILELYKNKSLPHLYQLILNNDLERTDFIQIMEEVQKIYNDLLHENNNISSKYNYFTQESLKNLKFDKNNELLITKIKAINENTEYLRYNVNIKTVLDKIFIDIYGGDLNA